MASLLARAFAPVLRARGAGGGEDQDAAAKFSPEGAPEGGARELPEMEYPVPLIVKNTFIDAPIGRPLSLDGFLEEREVHSSPASTIDGAWQPQESHGLAATARLRDRFAYVPDAEGSASPESTSPGSLSARSSVTDSPPCAVNSLGPPDAAASCGAQRVPGLPDFSYPSPLDAKHIYIWAGTDWPLPVDSFREAFGNKPGNPTCGDLGWPAGTLPSAPEPPAMASAAQQPGTTTLSLASALPPLPCVTCALAPVLLLTPIVEAPALGSPELPTLGSADHRSGTCRPCAHAYSSRGCNNGTQCPFCHLCPPGELKRQQKAKRQAQRRAEANAMA